MATVSEFINKVGFKVKNEDVSKVNSTISNIKDSANKILGAIGVSLSLAALNDLVEEFTRVKQQITNSTNGLGNQVEIQQKILAAATATRTAYADTAKMVSNLVHENSELFGSVDEAIKFYNAATMLLKTAGKTNEDIAGLMEAINKSFAKGYVDSETLSQLLERSPEAVELLNNKLGTTSDQLEKMASDSKFTVEDLKNAFVDSADEISEKFSNVKISITDAITVIRNKFGLWVADTNEMLDVTNTIGGIMVKSFDGVIRVVTKVRTGMVWLTEKVGGFNNLLKLLAIVAGSMYIAFNFSKIVSGFQSIISFISKLNVKTLAIGAVIAMIALAVEDFFNFMKGNNSLLGSMLEKAGIDAEAVRQTIIDAWAKAKSFLLETWDAIKNAASKAWNFLSSAAVSVFNGLKSFWTKHSDDVKSAFVTAWESVKSALSTVWNFIGSVGKSIFSGLQQFWEKHGQTITTSFSNIWNGIKTRLASTWNVIKTVAQIAFAAIKIAVETIFSGIKQFWETWGGTITSYLSGFWGIVKSIFSTALDIVVGLFAVFSDIFGGNWKQLWEDVKTLLSNVWDGIGNIISTSLNVAWGVISSVLSVIWGYIVEVWNNIVSAITNALGAVVSVISNVWNSITSITSNIWNGIKSTVANIVSGVLSNVSSAFNSLKSSVSTTWNSIKSAITDPINEAWTAVKSVVDKLKSAFNFQWSLPELKLPHISVSGGEAPFGIGGKGSLPQFSIQWYKKGGILPRSAIFGAMGGKLLGGGEAGKEAVLPLTELWSNMRMIIQDGVSDLVKIIQPMAGMDSVSSATVSNVSNSSVRKSVVQHVEFNNEFHGDTAIQRHAATAMKQSSADVTAELARGLAYAR